MSASKHGTFSWCELLTTDVEAAKKFYGQLFGWAAAGKVRDLGGDIIVPLKEIPGVGRYCVIRDPQGATLALITYLPGHE